MKRVIITEEQEKKLVGVLKGPNVSVRYSVSPDKVNVVRKFLDKNFKRGQLSKVGDDGLPQLMDIVAMIDGNGDVLKNLYKEQLTELFIDHFSNMFLNHDERGRFMKQVVEDWYGNKIGPFGTLSKNYV